MREFTPEEIQSQFEKLPKELQDAISSSEVHENIKAVGNKHDLMIDKIGDLVDQVGLVMLGLAKGSNFVNDIATRLSISTQDAQSIANDINTDVFSLIKSHMKDTEEQSRRSAAAASTISSLEQAGGFTVEQPAPEIKSRVTADDQVQVLKDLENPSRHPEAFTEPLVDQLLQNPTARPEQPAATSSVPPKPPATAKPPTPPKPATPPARKGPDAYREPI